ncbi:MAG: hypothetical protein K2I69_03055 [Muribaculaceae bacterium]|nr:hypothetical protein [Muribaculaceae bacterium]MDE6575116.1 hypothetical protein [Muribaculaceae bacterium]
MQASSRIVLNTLAQVLKTFAGIILGFYSTRIILQGLGEEDYGIYMLLAGIVGLLSFLNNALSATTQRFLSYNQASRSLDYIKKTFANSLFLHLMFALISLFVLECVGFFLLDGWLNIAEDRLFSARIVYHCAVTMVFLTLITTPFRALLVAHENLVYTSFIDIIDAVLKVLIAFFVLDYSGDRLILYATLMIGINVFTLIAFALYSGIRFEEFTIRFRGVLSKDFIRSMTSFTGWALYSTFCIIGRNQGVAIVINKFFGTVLNASYGIAAQVSGGVNYISAALLNAIAPPLTRAEGNGNRELAIQLACTVSKFCSFLMAAVTIPLIFRLQEVLTLWLGELPERATLFTTVVLASSFFDSLSVGLSVANKAYGKLQRYSLSVDSFKLAVLPILAILLYCRISLFYAFWVFAILELISAIMRIIIMHKLIGVDIFKWFKNVIWPVVWPTCILFILYLSVYRLYFSWGIFVIEIIFFTSVFIFLVFAFATDDFEKKQLSKLRSSIPFLK